jgi:nucleotidyltransferase/DNA polymerase involved in DNA repair
MILRATGDLPVSSSSRLEGKMMFASWEHTSRSSDLKIMSLDEIFLEVEMADEDDNVEHTCQYMAQIKRIAKAVKEKMKSDSPDFVNRKYPKS